MVELVNRTDIALAAMAARLCVTPTDKKVSISDLDTPEKQDAYLAKLKKRGHMTPFEFVQCTFFIQGITRAALAQLTRHRTMSFCVTSQRYTKAKMDAFRYDASKGAVYLQAQKKAALNAITAYDELIASGVKAEDARMILPAMATTNVMLSVNLRDLLHFLELRTDPHAQKEIRGIALEMRGLIESDLPLCFGEEK